MTDRYDVVVGGGSVAGLVIAAEVARKGYSVLVAEEHDEIGEPEKCDGLVSLRGLRKFGYEPRTEVIQSKVSSGVIHSSSGRRITIDSSGLEIVVMDRSAYDKQLSEVARLSGADLKTGTRAVVESKSADSVSVKIGEEVLKTKYYVDATGPSAGLRQGIMPAAKYEVEGDWVFEGMVEVFIDAKKYPGFFAWVIPRGKHVAKVGVAGYRINAFAALDSFLDQRPHRILRRVAAPIFIGGPVSRFAVGRVLKVGESAGQVKPTTAGGIVTSVAGGVIAARWVGESIRSDDPSILEGYQAQWESRFMKEMKVMMRLRRVFEKLSNSDVESVLKALSSSTLLSKLSQSDFDFHATGLLGALGMKGVLRVAKVVASAEARSLLSEPT